MGMGSIHPNQLPGSQVQGVIQEPGRLEAGRGSALMARAARTHIGCATEGNEMPPETLQLKRSAATPAATAKTRHGPYQGMPMRTAKVRNHSSARPPAMSPSVITSSGDRPVA